MSGIYTGAMGIMSNMTRMDLIANNIANAQTKGYKSDSNTFRVYDETQAVKRSFKDKTGIGDYENMVYVDDIKTNFKAGSYEVSENPLDLAITDDANQTHKTFFSVSKNGQEYLTKNGQFTLDEDRRISTYTGELVSGVDGNPIAIPENRSYEVEKDGKVVLSDTHQVVGQIRMLSVADENLVFLQKESSSLFSVMNLQDINNRFAPIGTLVNEYNQNVTYRNLFQTNNTLLDIQRTGQVNVTEPPKGSIETHMTESSNVDVADELVAMMETQKGVQSSQKVWQTLGDILDKESNQIGR
ncbi:hypothetical protein CN918_27775 [Priestia megaterium]|nr:hypothetical protein CN918_27775 [Priestia megaterium]